MLVVDYCCGLGIQRAARAKVRGAILALSMVFNLGLLGVFKYFNFFQESFTALAKSLGIVVEPFALSIILPVGISFYTFQTLSYSIDVYRRQLKPTRSFIDYVVYVSFFPQLVAGPIERGSRMLPQILKSRTFQPDDVVLGLQQIVWGFFKMESF